MHHTCGRGVREILWLASSTSCACMFSASIWRTDEADLVVMEVPGLWESRPICSLSVPGVLLSIKLHYSKRVYPSESRSDTTKGIVS